jgi:phosphoribosylformylglycinamidine synthase I
MKAAVVVFPGSNCDHDAEYVCKAVLGVDVRQVWHMDRDLGSVDLVVLPGGFSYGDYLRTGAIARFSPVMESVREFAGRGGFVLGICNGFQILQEAGLLPGAMLRNSGLKFVCRHVHLRVERTDTPFTSKYRAGAVLSIPIAHNEGNFYASAEDLESLEKNRQVVFRYAGAAGEVDAASNPNGSLHNIAGIVNRRGNVLGMMPHPERASEPQLGSDDGRPLFESILAAVAERVEATV